MSVNFGREIQLRAFDSGIKTIHDLVFLSPQGLAARQAAHRFAVERTLAAGDVVPEEVLADYPDLSAGDLDNEVDVPAAETERPREPCPAL